MVSIEQCASENLPSSDEEGDRTMSQPNIRPQANPTGAGSPATQQQRMECVTTEGVLCDFIRAL